MEVSFEHVTANWRGRGRPRREILPVVKDMADRTLNTGRFCLIEYNPNDEVEEAKEICRQVRSYAKSLGLIPRIQMKNGQLRFLMSESARKNEESTDE